MRPITVSVGPLAAGSATALAAAQTPTVAGQLLLAAAAPTGGAFTQGWAGTASITNGVLTTTATTAGIVQGGARLNGMGVAPNTRIIGSAPGSTGNTWIVSPTQTVASATMRTDPVLTFDQPRQVLITTTQVAGSTVTVTGTDGAGNPISETLATSGAALTTNQNFKTVTQIAVSGAFAVTISAGSAGTATSQWVNFDPWAFGNISYQTDLAGVANYTVQITNDDPNSPTNPVPPGQMTWLPDPNAAMVGASANEAAVWQFVPLYARILLNSGAGAVSGTFVQAGSVTR
jgi:hypothetical protein